MSEPRPPRPGPERFSVARCASIDDVESARALFRECAAWLAVDLCFQGFAEELATLPGRNAPPDGCLLLARLGGEPAGCVALRRLDARSGEVKRLFVREQFRGMGLGERLAREVVERARDGLRARRARHAAADGAGAAPVCCARVPVCNSSQRGCRVRACT